MGAENIQRFMGSVISAYSLACKGKKKYNFTFHKKETKCSLIRVINSESIT